MEGTAVAVCEILRYLIIHWKCETAELAKEALLEGQLVISTEALSSKHQANTLHCVTTIASAGGSCGGLVLKSFLKEIHSILPGLSAKLMWTSEETSCSLDPSGISPFQMSFEVDAKPRALMTDCLAIKNFLRKIITVHPKLRFHFTVRVNGTLSKEIFRVENKPILNLPNGVALVTNYQHYVSRPKFGSTELLCSRIHPVPGHPVMLSIPDDMAAMGLLGELILTPAAALCPCLKGLSSQTKGISSVSIFLYGPSGLPLILPRQAQSATLFTDLSCLIDWKEDHLCVIPNLDFSVDTDLVLPDASYQVEPCEGDQSPNMDPRGHTLLLFLFVDFHSGFPVQRMELWGVHTWLTTHLDAILTESQREVRGSVQMAVTQALEQHYRAAEAHQKLQTCCAVAVNSILSVVVGSTNSSFRKKCLQAFQAADTREFGTKLHKAFNEMTQRRLLHPFSREGKQQLLPEKPAVAQSTEDPGESSSREPLPEASAQSKRRKRGAEKTRARRSARAASPPQAVVSRRPEPAAVSPGPSERPAGAEQRRAPAPGSVSPRNGLEDALWLQEVSNLSEWLSDGPQP